MKRRHLLVIGLTIVGGLSPLASPAAQAETLPPGGICADGNYFDGVDTRPSAAECQTSLSGVSYAVTRLTNQPAQGAVENLPTTAVFYHSGHALVTCSDPTSFTDCTAQASVFAPTSSTDTTYTTLLGDPTAGTLQGPVELCAGVGQELIGAVALPGGKCKDVTLVQYPYESLFTRVNLAVFDSCDSAHDGVNGYTSLASEAFANHAGTAIGWKKEIAGKDEFSKRFFSDLTGGSTYLNSLVDAANNAGAGTLNYGSYVYLHVAGAPTTLRPSSYYLPATGVTSRSGSDSPTGNFSPAADGPTPGSTS